MEFAVCRSREKRQREGWGNMLWEQNYVFVYEQDNCQRVQRVAERGHG